MLDEEIKNALVAIGGFVAVNLEGQMALSNFIANRMPGLSQEERQLWLTALESDKNRLETLKSVLDHL